MNIKIYPSKVSGEVTIPPSKSMAHRAIICASLAKGTSIITNIDYSNDIIATIKGMERLGAEIIPQNNSLIIKGIDDFSLFNKRVIDCNESGSTLRFFIPIFSLTNKKITFKGKNRLMYRPQKIYKDIFSKQNLLFEQSEEKISIKGSLKPGYYEINGDISSQFISGLLFTLPLLESDSTIKIIPPFESKSYVNLTIDVLKNFGINVYFQDENTIYIKGKQKYSPCNYTVEGDFSQLGFFAVLGTINSSVKCNGLNTDSLQGDKEIIDILKKCGSHILTEKNGYIFSPNISKGIKIDLANCPDLGPILMILAMFGKGDFHLYNAKRLRYKESDRIDAMESELKKLGVNIHSDEDNVYIKGGKNYSTSEILSGQKDHRIVMSLSIAATMCTCPISISGIEAIFKSYPNFFKDLKKLSVKYELFE